MDSFINIIKRKPRVFVITSRIYETAGGRTKATIGRMMFLKKHFNATLIEMSETKYPGQELPAIFTKYKTTFTVTNPWHVGEGKPHYKQNYLQFLKRHLNLIENKDILRGKQEGFTISTLTDGTIKSYQGEDGKISRLRQFHTDGTVSFYGLDIHQNIFIHELYRKDTLLKRHYLNDAGEICSGFDVEEDGKKRYIYRTKDDQLLYSENIANHNTLFLNDLLRDGDTIISDVRYYDDLLERIEPSVKKIHVWHEIATNIKGKAINPAYKRITSPEYPMSHSDRIVVFTEDARDEYEIAFPHLKDKFVVIPYGTNVKKVPTSIERDKNALLSIGRLEPAKNVEAQIRAFAIFHKKYPKTYLTIFGDGSEKDKLKQLTEELKLEKVVAFKGFTHNVDEEFQRSSMMLFSSHFETFGLTIMESLSNGTPVASYNVRFGAKSLIDDTKNGTLSKRNTPASLANAMIKVYEAKFTPTQVTQTIMAAFSKKGFEKKWRSLLSKKIRSNHNHRSLGIITEHRGFTRQIWSLAWIDLQKSYRGALIGWLWVIIRPLIMLGFYWFIIAVGFRSDIVPGESYEYLPWLVVGLCVWFFVSDMVDAGLGAFRRYKFLITKTRFPIATIPSIVSTSNVIVHSILLMIVLGYLYLSGYVALEWLQLPFYIFLTLALMWFWSFFAAPLGAMSKDFTQLVKSLLRVLIWVSGILWSIHSIHIHWLREVMQLNPIFYLAEGYRNALIYHKWFFEDIKGLLIFIIELLLLGTIAAIVYKRTRKEVVDTL